MHKLSDTFHNLAGHLEHYASTAVGIESTALKYTSLFANVLHSFAGLLEASPVTIPGVAIPAPGAK